MTGVTTSLSVPSLSDEGKARLTDPHSLRDYQHSQAAPGLRGGGWGSGWEGKCGVAAGPSAPGDLPLFLNDSVVPQAVEHLTRVISSTRGSGQKLQPISAVDTDTIRENSTDSSESAVVADLDSCQLCNSLGALQQLHWGERGGGGSSSSFLWQLLWPQEAVQQTPTACTSMGRQIVDVS
ncbi:hypothetical protein NQZ68_002114 [Dissostichus eleginoides]|nr:hypothetical protein NQZ68_002114 [Dissostichus eleginoides]